MIKIKYILTALFLIINSQVHAECESSLALEGTISIKSCDSKTQNCISAATAINEYMGKVKDDPKTLTVGMHTSPWHFYGDDMRILRIQDVALLLKPYLKDPIKRIVLVSSWSGVKPDEKTKSLSEQLSDSLNGFPVSGMDGFVWISSDGSLHTTHQAFTMRKSGAYNINPGDDVMQALAIGWFVEAENFFIKEKDANGLVQAGAGWDIFQLCPDHALKTFEIAAKLSNSIAAYNAALIHLGHKNKEETKKAILLLTQAANAGDKKAKEVLDEVTKL